ncbi:MAG TPA: hypothetical protein VLB09_01705 [Nitrospiria bacterium]|nr:hypothetical protein [Nitrospiria bacterium]
MRILLILALLYLGFVLLKGAAGFLYLSKEKRKREGAAANKMVQDPVCEVYLPRDRAIEKTGKEGPRYFCSEKCAEEFARKGERVG